MRIRYGSKRAVFSMWLNSTSDEYLDVDINGTRKLSDFFKVRGVNALHLTFYMTNQMQYSPRPIQPRRALRQFIKTIC